MAEVYPGNDNAHEAAVEVPVALLGDEFWRDASLPIDAPPNRVKLIDNGQGGQLAYMVDGPSKGSHVINIGGNPSGLVGPNMRSMHLHLSGIACATYDRPGYGYSTRRPGRAVADGVEDVERIVNDLGWDEFSIVARSGGVPHALAAASKLGRRVTRIALLAGVSEVEPSNPEKWSAGMTESNAGRHAAARKDPMVLAYDYKEVAKRTQRDPASFLETLKDSYTELDEQIIGVLGLTRMLGEGYAWALRQGGAGWFDDTIALHRKWDINWGNITAEAFVWHGKYDPFAQADHAHENTKKLSQAVSYISSAASHFNAMQVAVPAASWAAHGDMERLEERLEDVDRWMVKARRGMNLFEWDLLKGLWQAYETYESPMRYTRSPRLPL